MFTQSSCPEPEIFQELLSGKLDIEQASAIEQHILECDACGEKLLELAASDSLLQSFNRELLDQADDNQLQGLVKEFSDPSSFQMNPIQSEVEPAKEIQTDQTATQISNPEDSEEMNRSAISFKELSIKEFSLKELSLKEIAGQSARPNTTNVVEDFGEFYRLLSGSGLFTETKIQEIKSKHQAATEVEEVLLSLVKEKQLTQWQASQLYLGKPTLTVRGYVLLEKLGEGGMGSVFRAKQEFTNRLVALKLISERVLEKENSKARFLREAKAAAALDHPNIVTAFDAYGEGKTYFLVMESVEGEDLADWLRKHKKLDVHWCCECVRQTALGLQHAHEQGLVHRDIKPSNLLITGDEAFTHPVVKILDFGLARFSVNEDDEDNLTKTGQVMGTPEYIAPEQARNTKAADIRADIFSLGCTFFRILTGEPAFDGDSSLEQIAARFSGPAKHLQEFDPELPDALNEIVQKMLAQDREDRFQEPKEVVAALEQFMQQFPPATTPAGTAIKVNLGAKSETNSPSEISRTKCDVSSKTVSASATEKIPTEHDRHNKALDDSTATDIWKWVCLATGVIVGGGIVWLIWAFLV